MTAQPAGPPIGGNVRRNMAARLLEPTRQLEASAHPNMAAQPARELEEGNPRGLIAPQTDGEASSVPRVIRQA